MPDKRPLPEHVTLPLLTKITRDSLDEDYQHAALRRQTAGDEGDPDDSGSPWAKHRLAAVAAAVFGLLVVISAVQTERNAGTTELAREELISQIEQRRDALRDHQREISDLRRSNESSQRNLDRLEGREATATNERNQLAALTGYLPVTGEGVEITVDDAADGSDDGRVRDEDLATLMDGLFAAGAEAITINGLRVSTLTGIRNIGDSPHLGARPLKPPYKILAVGENSTLQADFANSSAGIEFYNLRASFGFSFSMVNRQDLSLEGRDLPTLTYAQGAAPTGKELRR